MSYLVQEVDGTSKFTLEAGAGALLLESGVGPPVNTGAPVASGTATVGQTVSTTDGTWTDDGSPIFSRKWQRDNSGGGVYTDIGGATSTTYTLVSADLGCHVRSVITDTDSGGSTSAASNALGPVAAAPVSAGPTWWSREGTSVFA